MEKLTANASLNEDKNPDNSVKLKWSLFGKVVMLATPILIWLLAAIYSSELKGHADIQESHPSVVLLTDAFGIFLVRIGAILILIINIFLLFAPPAKSFPKWFKTKRD
jgi:hypothetical protein